MVIEAQTLAYDPEPMEIKAGIEVFNKYGSLNVIETLSGGDINKWDDVMGMPYERVYTKLLMNRDKGEFDRKYRDLMMEQK